MAPLSLSTTAKAFILQPIGVGLVEAFDVEKGKSKYRAALLLMAMTGNNIASTAFLTATVPNLISAQYMTEATGVGLCWFRWLVMALPLTLLLFAVSWFFVVRMFKPELEETAQSLERIRGLREELGPMSRGERIVAFFFATSRGKSVCGPLHLALQLTTATPAAPIVMNHVISSIDQMMPSPLKGEKRPGLFSLNRYECSLSRARETIMF